MLKKESPCGDEGPLQQVVAMARRFMTWALLLFLGSACPSTWGKEGYVQKTFHKNLMQRNSEYRSCQLSEDEWWELCGEEEDHEGSCPKECPLPAELEPH